MAVMPCTYRKSLPDFQVKGRTVPSCSCGLVDDEIGWTHGFPVEACASCQAGKNPMTPASPFVTERIDKHLRLRVSRYWNWDDAPIVSSRVRKTLHEAAVLLKIRRGNQTLSEAILDAVKGGFPPDRAKELVKEIMPEAVG